MCYLLTKTDFSWSILRLETTILQTWDSRVYSVLKILDWVLKRRPCIPTIPDTTFTQVFKIQKEWKQSEEMVGLSSSRRHYSSQILVLIPSVTCWYCHVDFIANYNWVSLSLRRKGKRLSRWIESLYSPSNLQGFLFQKFTVYNLAQTINMLKSFFNKRKEKGKFSD